MFNLLEEELEIQADEAEVMKWLRHSKEKESDLIKCLQGAQSIVMSDDLCCACACMQQEILIN